MIIGFVIVSSLYILKKKESSEPSEVTRLNVWVKSRTKKDGTAVNTDAAAKIVSIILNLSVTHICLSLNL